MTNNKLTFREWSAAAMLFAGVCLSIAGFIVPPVGDISDSVLWFFAQCCIYAGSMMGVSVYAGKMVNKRFDEFLRGTKLNKEEKDE